MTIGKPALRIEDWRFLPGQGRYVDGVALSRQGHAANRGAIGGSVANYYPAVDYPAALITLEAESETESRKISAWDFPFGRFETALDDHKLVTAINLDAPDAARYKKFTLPASDHAMAGIFISRTGGKHRARVIGASGRGAFRCDDLEQLLDAGAPLAGRSNPRFHDRDILEDRHGSRAYWENLVRILARRTPTYLVPH